MNTSSIATGSALSSLLLGAFLMPFGALAQTKSAQSAPQLIANQAQARESVLPLRNLQIEVRQLGSEASERRSIDAQGRVIVQPGRSRGDASVNAEQQRESQKSQLSQQALVLNGRSVSFTLGQTVPLRVVQVLAFNGNLHFVPSVILIDRNSAFSARPLWYGDDVAEIEISTVRAQGQSQNAQGSRQSSATTTLQVQMNEWITIAHSEESQSSSVSGILSRSSEQGQSSLRVEMRVTVR